MGTSGRGITYQERFDIVSIDWMFLRERRSDDLRRGRPTAHRAYDEATAILAGDALQALAFEVLAGIPGIHSDQGRAIVREVSKACGSQGMAGGQALDLEAANSAIDLTTLQQIHAMKTGALIEAAVLMGALAAGIDSDEQLNALSDYAKALGLGFQIHDDILDVVSDTKTLGKQTGADEVNGKATYPGLLGLTAARQAAADAQQQAEQALKRLPLDTGKLQMLAEYAINRIY